jgi:hypothetical protein
MKDMSARFVFAAAASFVLAPAFAQLPEDLKRKFDQAERRIVRLPPTAFPEFPVTVVRELQRRGCTVPQTAYLKKPHNVIKGEFAKPGQTDWAVLCSVKGVSTILVFWNGSEKNPAAIAPMEDRNFLQTINTTDPGFSRGINPVGKDFIIRHYDAYGGLKPPPIEHQGIDDAFIEKASVVWYFHDGKWLKLTGAD